MIFSLSDRENPSVAITWQPENNTQIRLKVSAAATSLRNRESVLVQVLGFPEPPVGPLWLKDQCITSRRLDDIEKDDLAVLLWEDSGPDQEGKSTVTSSIHFTQGLYAAACVG